MWSQNDIDFKTFLPAVISSFSSTNEFLCLYENCGNKFVWGNY